MNKNTDNHTLHQPAQLIVEPNIAPEFRYLENLIAYRLNSYFPVDNNISEPVLPFLNEWHFPIAAFIGKHRLSQDEAIVLLAALAPHLQPDLFDRVIEGRLHNSGEFPKIGGVRGKNCRFFLPSGETVLFLIAGDDVKKRLRVQLLFGSDHFFREKKIVWLEDMQPGEPSMHGRLIMSPDYVDLFTYGIHKSPQFSISFPAKKIAPAKPQDNPPPTFNDLVIPDELSEQINELKSWLKYNEQLMKKFGMLRKGYRTLFYGPPGTGKTFTAQILGNELNKEVFKIDLSMVVSKYIGETEKNLELLFARAEDKGWILFFDEADALFGKRTNVRDAHDKYANQEVSYLLQRIEDYNGLVILATNMKNNIDEAFIRRFNSILSFPFPNAAQRALIWKKLTAAAICRKRIPGNAPGEESEVMIDLPEAVKKYELSGGNIVNIIHYAGIKAIEIQEEKKKRRKKNADLVATVAGSAFPEEMEDEPDPRLAIYLSDVLDGIKRELTKEGKPFSV